LSRFGEENFLRLPKKATLLKSSKLRISSIFMSRCS
jgi:hypothetical protein